MVVFPSVYVVVGAMRGHLAGDTFQLVVYMSPQYLAWYQSHEPGIQFILCLSLNSGVNIWLGGLL